MLRFSVRLIFVPVLLASVVALNAHARQFDVRQVDEIIASARAPDGVVFEVVDWNGDALAQALPKVSAMAKRLRQRFPDLDMVVVSHGREQFALLSENHDRKPEIHGFVQDLAATQNIQVEVCGTHAGMKGYDAGSFPQYVTVVPAAPAQINAYKELGYQHILID